jgi:hypothetical protein
MERYYAGTDVYNSESFPEIAIVRNWLKQTPNRLVWSVTKDAAAGIGSACTDHGAFDNEHTTVESLKHIVRSGF